MEEALTIAAFSSVSHLYKEEPKDHEEKNEYEKIMGELIVCVSSSAHAQDERGDQFTYLRIFDFLLNPPVEEGETPVHRSLASLTPHDINTFCSAWYLNAMAVKKMLELRMQYKYFVEWGSAVALTRSLLPEEAVQSLRTDAERKEAEERSTDESVMHCLIKAYFKNICKLASNGSYVPVNLLNDEGSNEGNIDVAVHEDSVLHMIRRVRVCCCCHA